MSTLLNEYQQFYRLSDPLASRPMRLTVLDDWVTKDVAVAIGWGEKSLLQPIHFRGYMGNQLTDVLWCGLTPLLCIHQRVIDLLISNDATGWSIFPVEVADRKGRPISDYFGLAIPQSVGGQDTRLSEIITKPAPTPGGTSYQVYKGMYFDLSKWAGSDLFRVHGFRIVTEKVVKAFKRAKITNVRFTPVSEVEISVDLDRYRQQEEVA